MDEELFNQHIQSYLFTDGIADGKWGVDETVGPVWPTVFIWIAAAKRPNSPDRFYFRFIANNYPLSAPEICIWDINTNTQLAHNLRPKGVNDNAIVFRSDWKGGMNLYAPYERVSLQEHSSWPAEYPRLCWKQVDTILKPLEHIHMLLNNDNYHGI